MAEEAIQQLSQAVNENSHYLRQNAQVMTESNTCITECTRTLTDKLGDLEFGDVNEHKDKFSTGLIRMFNGEPKYFDQWMKSIEKHAFLVEVQRIIAVHGSPRFTRPDDSRFAGT